MKVASDEFLQQLFSRWHREPALSIDFNFYRNFVVVVVVVVDMIFREAVSNARTQRINSRSVTELFRETTIRSSRNLRFPLAEREREL